MSGGSTGESGGGRLGGGRFVFGVALSVAFGTVCGSVGGDCLGSGGPVAFGTVCGAVGGNGLESLESGGPVVFATVCGSGLAIFVLNNFDMGPEKILLLNIIEEFRLF